MMNSSGGKGSATRPTSVCKETYSSNWDKIFSNKCTPNESKPDLLEQEKLKTKQSIN